jgi:hypothetical protein
MAPFNMISLNTIIMELCQMYFASISLFHIFFIKIPTKKIMTPKLLDDISPFIIETY